MFDDIEVPKDLVLDWLTMRTDPDFFYLTIQVVELILASFWGVCGKMPVDIQPVSNIDDRGRKIWWYLKVFKRLSQVQSVLYLKPWTCS